MTRSATNAAYQARGNQVIVECFHEVLKDFGTQTEVRLRLVESLRAAMLTHRALARAYVVAGTGPDGKPRAELALEAADPDLIIIPLPIGEWRAVFKRELRAAFAADRGHLTIQ